MLSALKSGIRFSSNSTEKLIQKVIAERPDGLLAEHEVLSIIGDLGFSIAPHCYATKTMSPEEVVKNINAKTVVAKGVVRYRKDGLLVTHKTDIGGLQFNIPNTPEGIAKAMKVFDERFNKNSPYELEGTLFVEQMKMSGDFGTELLVSGYQDPFFGPLVCYGFGGTTVEYLKSVMQPDHAQIFVPSLFTGTNYGRIIENLPASKLATGRVRGTKKHLDQAIVEPLLKNVQGLISKYSQYNRDAKYIIDELEVNPTVAVQGKMWALDGVMRVSPRGTLPYYDAQCSGKPLDRIECLTNPKSIVVAGASTTNPLNPGTVILKNAKDYGVKDCYVLHPKAKELCGVPAFKNLAALNKARNGEKIDLLSICIPAQGAGKLVSDAFDINNVKSIQVISGGFGETEHGSKMQNELHEKLLKMSNDRPVVNGPNTVGNLKEGGINTVFVPRNRSSSDGVSGARNCAFLCQSGAYMISRISDCSPSVLPKIAISVGNQLDLSVTDFLEHYVDLPDITTFGLYIEGLGDGQGISLMNVVKHANDIGKTVVIYKAGRSQAGVRAAKGHTAAMAGDYGMFKSLMENAGAIVADSTEQWNNIVTLATLYPSLMTEAKKHSIGIAALTNAGFQKCEIADQMMENGTENMLHLPKWSKQSLEVIDGVYKKYKIGEVVDVAEVLDVTPIFPDRGYYEILKGVLKDPQCDIAVCAFVPETNSMKCLEEELKDPNSILPLLKKLKAEYPTKPIICAIESGGKYRPLIEALRKEGIACFENVNAAAKAVVSIVRAANRFK
ncbi:CoA binding domain containing protein [Trichomonas vaginalis G3]|uniref:CoA binding domain containing protein n=1 Tax=Trichomonas vaginalis (strain ATCC PRA-98 / G3) TaxID=412133 RepID=A2F811_TRIV3|nr:COA binding domain containing protein family [Trichomonas vaginalis G3]EAX98943.1 CoA binding domain containing protein [Trichomonas vaginalis G3]KAI5533491.1 COA binding domain containing protein family [Trichomonas vaginalis G3]|eukprot:XP_001311873.1 CoA binding domain containing protein [Trichomonas vaginalis G3]